MKPTDALPHPADWSTATISKTVEIKRGISWSKEQEHLAPREGAIPVIRIGNVQEQLELDDLIYISGLKPKAIEKKRVAAGWAIIVGSNGNRQRIGNAVKIVDDTDFLFASFLIAAKPKPDSGITPEFFYRWLSSEQVQAYLSASSEGSTGLSNLSHSFFEAMAIPYPTTDEQAAIARILDAVDTVIERTREALDAVQTLRTSITHEAISLGIDKNQYIRNKSGQQGAGFQITKLGQFPRDWRITTLGKVCSKIVDGIHQSVVTSREGIPFLYVSCIRHGRVYWNRAARVNERDYAIISKGRKPKKGAVLYTAVGSYGHAAVVENDAPFSFQRHIAILYPKEQNLDPFFLATWINSSKGRRWSDIVAVGNAQKTVTLAALGKFPIALPSFEEQLRIRELLEPINKLVDAKEEKLLALEQLKKSLMHDLLTGKVRVGDSGLSPPP